ncbi:unnamed protein product [Onchocerca ochengi]|uniref:Uncharacterized protein n=1 Tax=Onchocerca ochengi TaxID=42157 RepID=A0A182ERC7_ONCOC|nr:unnamed protein product [Onchocerca ochengi]
MEKNNIIIRTRRLFGMSESKEINVDHLITLWSLLLNYLIEEMTKSFRADVRARELNKNNWLQNEDEQNNAHLAGRKATMRTQLAEQMKTSVEQRNKRENSCCGFKCFGFDQHYDNH